MRALAQSDLREFPRGAVREYSSPLGNSRISSLCLEPIDGVGVVRVELLRRGWEPGSFVRTTPEFTNLIPVHYES